MSSPIPESDGLVLRLAAEDRAIFPATFDTRLHEAHRTVQEEFVVPDGLFADSGRVAPWFAAAHVAAAATPPESTRRHR